MPTKVNRIKWFEFLDNPAHGRIVIYVIAINNFIQPMPQIGKPRVIFLHRE